MAPPCQLPLAALHCRAGRTYSTNARSAWADLPYYQVLRRNRQQLGARGELAEQIAVQIIHLRANEDSDLGPVAPDRAISNDGEDLRRVRIQNDVLGKDKILSHAFCLGDDGSAGPARVLGSTAGQVLARFGQGELSALSQFGRSGGARRQPSETTHAMVRQKKAPRRMDRHGATARFRLGGKN